MLSDLPGRIRSRVRPETSCTILFSRHLKTRLAASFFVRAGRLGRRGEEKANLLAFLYGAAKIASQAGRRAHARTAEATSRKSFQRRCCRRRGPLPECIPPMFVAALVAAHSASDSGACSGVEDSEKSEALVDSEAFSAPALCRLLSAKSRRGEGFANWWTEQQTSPARRACVKTHISLSLARVA